MANEPPSLNWQPFDPGPDHAHVPAQKPCNVIVLLAVLFVKFATSVWFPFRGKV